MDDYRGRVTLVSFWAAWCAPCRKEMPSLARLSRALPTDRFAVLAVNAGDSEAKARRFLEEVDADGLTVLLDRRRSLAAPWFLRGLPVTYVVDAAGKVVLGAVGDRVWDAPEMEAAIRFLAD